MAGLRLAARQRSRMGAVDRRRYGLGSPGKLEERLAVAVLSGLSIASIWSSVNPSFFTLMSFATRPEARERALKGIWIGFWASTAASVSIWVVFKDWIPAVIGEATAVGLLLGALWSVNQKPPAGVAAIEAQEGIPGP